jgi:hypothetical protein
VRSVSHSKICSFSSFLFLAFSVCFFLPFCVCVCFSLFVCVFSLPFFLVQHLLIQKKKSSFRTIFFSQKNSSKQFFSFPFFRHSRPGSFCFFHLFVFLCFFLCVFFCVFFCDPEGAVVFPLHPVNEKKNDVCCLNQEGE